MEFPPDAGDEIAGRLFLGRWSTPIKAKYPNNRYRFSRVQISNGTVFVWLAFSRLDVIAVIIAPIASFARRSTGCAIDSVRVPSGSAGVVH